MIVHLVRNKNKRCISARKYECDCSTVQKKKKEVWLIMDGCTVCAGWVVLNYEMKFGGSVKKCDQTFCLWFQNSINRYGAKSTPFISVGRKKNYIKKREQACLSKSCIQPHYLGTGRTSWSWFGVDISKTAGEEVGKNSGLSDG